MRIEPQGAVQSEPQRGFGGNQKVVCGVCLLPGMDDISIVSLNTSVSSSCWVGSLATSSPVSWLHAATATQTPAGCTLDRTDGWLADSVAATSPSGGAGAGATDAPPGTAGWLVTAVTNDDGAGAELSVSSAAVSTAVTDMAAGSEVTTSDNRQLTTCRRDDGWSTHISYTSATHRCI